LLNELLFGSRSRSAVGVRLLMYIIGYVVHRNKWIIGSH
jgi:hypothetical protein